VDFDTEIQMALDLDQLTSHLRDQLVSDPYPIYAEMRRLNQPLFVPHHPADTNKAPGKWLLSTYAQAQFILNDTVHFTKNNAASRTRGPEPGFDASMLFQDEPEHRRLRSLVEDLFRRTAINRYAEVVSGNAKLLLAEHECGDTLDLVQAFAEPLPLLTITELLGIPKTKMPILRRLSRAITSATDDLTVTESTYATKAAAYKDLGVLMQAGLNGEWEPPQDSLLLRLRNLTNDSTLRQDQAIAMLTLLLFAGHETTIALIGSCLYLLFAHPEQRRLLQTNPDLLTGAIEESLRFESPLQRSTFRMTLSDIAIEGHHFGPGEQVSAILGSANRDEKIFSNAHSFRIDRFPNPHLAFGRGNYHCIGRHLSALEARIAIQEFLNHFGKSSLAGQAQWQPNSFVRSLQNLPFHLGA
jgi:pimeloyl-[acyl-carrier protein] synthase